MIRLLSIFFFLSISLFADDFEQSYNATVEGDPSAMVDGCVSAITGNLYLNSIDTSSSGKEQIKFGRNYYNIQDWFFKSNGLPCDINENYIARQKKGGWEYFSHLYLFINYNRRFKKKDRRLDVYEHSGVMQSYHFWHHKKKDEGKNLPRMWRPDAFVNTSRGEISGRSNYKRNLVYRFNETDIKVLGVDGSIRNYVRANPSIFTEEDFNNLTRENFASKNIKEEKDKPYHLDTEILSNGYTLKYFYDEKHLNNPCEDYFGDPPKRIELISPSGKLFGYLDVEINSFTKNKDKFREFLVTTNSGKKTTYQFEDMKSKEPNAIDLLKKINSDYGEEKIKYDVHHFSSELREYKFSKGSELRFNYCDVLKSTHHNVVSEIIIATSPNVFETVHRFEYKQDYTAVRDFKNNLTNYVFDKNTLRLSKIERFDGDSLKNIEKFIWGTYSQEGFLLGKVIFDGKRIPIKAEKNIYDKNDVGNIETKIIYGCVTGENKIPIVLDSSGLPKDNGTDCYIKKYTYYPNYLIKSEVDQSGLTTEYTYLKCDVNLEKDFLTDLPLTKFIKYNDKIKLRNFYIYDKDNILIKEIIDDGSSLQQNDLKNVNRRLIKVIVPRQVKPYGLTDIMEEKYLDLSTNQEILLRKEKYEYFDNCKISKREIYGSDNKLKYTLYYKYDSKDNIIYETDPLGREALYEYDENNNRVREVDFSKREIIFKYDNCNRLISKTINGDENLKEEYGYDLNHNKIFEKDIYGNVKKYEYDPFNSIIKETFSEVQDSLGKKIIPIKSYSYDALGRQISKTDALNNTTETTYNIFNKPIFIKHPDLTTETFIYNLEGTLKKYINQEGTVTAYGYDHLKRLTSKKISSNKKILSEEIFEYDSFNIISKTDADGNVIRYSYDDAGRKIKEELISKDQKLLSIEELFYDEHGFISKKIDGRELITNFERDVLGRVLVETKLNFSDELLYKIKYEYDEYGNKNVIISNIANQESVQKKIFDPLNRLIKTIDAFGYETEVNYGYSINSLSQKVRQQIQENPLGRKTIITFDALNREKTIECRNIQDLTLSFEEKFYDPNGNLTRQISTIYNPDRSTKKVTTSWQYDNMNRLEALIENCGSKDEKITRYTYTANGNLKSIIKPDGIILNNEYDPLGNKIRFYSSKKDINYEFLYNNLNQIEKAIDLNTNEITYRRYDAKGNLLEEQLSYGPIIQSKYDLLQKKRKTTLPDGSFIEYLYDPINLNEVIKKDKKGALLYRHEFLSYDLSGNLLKENLILNSGEVDYQLDLLGRIVSINTPYHAQKIKYDEIGRISKVSYKGFFKDEVEYAYDELDQIISESNLFSNTYEYDSHNNRVKKNNLDYDVNNLNEIQSISSQEPNSGNDSLSIFYVFKYDPNGNPISKKNSAEETKYYYDSLDRLIKVENPNYILDFTYDAFNRRISKKSHKIVHGYLSSYWADVFEYFLYDNQNEIGSYDEKLNQKELRILSETKTAEIASAIAFEIAGVFYAPIYDISGNVISLIFDGYLYEHYRYSAFGERKIFSYTQNEQNNSKINNPWQFCSKRIDEETGLIYFGRRYYDPTLGRWLTPDPKGFQDGLNLYAFVLNDPLIKMDLYGLNINYPLLNTTPWFLASIQAPTSQFIPSQRFVVGLNERSGIGIGYINGINTNINEARRDGERISAMVGNLKVNVTYNQTLGQRKDFGRCCIEYTNRNFITQAGKELMKDWFDFFSKEKQNCYLQVCFSEGALITRNALSQMPEHIRKKIIVLAIAPGAYIDKELCKSVQHYRSKNDFVPKLDVVGKLVNSRSTTVLEPHPDVQDNDHHFESPTYERVLQDRLDMYLLNPKG